jgi:hypothetical protein
MDMSELPAPPEPPIDGGSQVSFLQKNIALIRLGEVAVVVGLAATAWTTGGDMFIALPLLVTALLVSLLGIWGTSAANWIKSILSFLFVIFFAAEGEVLNWHFHGYFWPLSASEPAKIPETASEPKKPDELPDVTLRFTSPLSPTVVLVNQSNALAKNIIWSVELWNMDDPRTYVNPNPDPDVHDPLPIPSTKAEFLRPHATDGPRILFGQSPIYSYVKNGQRLAGSASVICGECARGHTYIVSIVLGEGGWYAEQKDKKEGELIVPMTGKREAVNAYYQSLINSVPQADRVPIAP